LKILVSWLRDFVDVPVAPARLAADLHMAGFEVASVEPPPGAASVDDDAVIDLEITANRPDCLSVIGIAREAATLYDTELRLPSAPQPGAADPKVAADLLRVTIEDPVRCPRYCGALADVTVGVSPDWLQQRLAAAGVRAINNIVDVTNYVLIETGHPMHAFDFDRLGGRELRIRLAATGERVTTLDGQERKLGNDTLVIADAGQPQAVAGVMGGAASEVSLTTRVIAFESAYFEPAGIRRTSRQLGLSTEASYRFERGADIAAPPIALARACALLGQIGAGRARAGWVDAFPLPRDDRYVGLAVARVAQVLGTDVPRAEIERVLTGLGFRVVDRGDTLDVAVPSWRVDVARDVDLVEEIARHYGYDRLPTTFPALTTVPAPPDRRLERDRLVRRVAAAAGFAESVTFSFIAADAAALFAGGRGVVEILNPLSEQFTVLRPSLLPGVLSSLAHNVRRGQDDVRLFEVGTSFSAGAGERRRVACAWTGTASAAHWSGSGRGVDFFDIKGVVELVAGALGVTTAWSPAEVPYLVRGRAAHVALPSPAGSPFQPDSGMVGVAGQLLPSLAARWDLPAHTDVYVAEIDLDALLPVMTFDAAVASTPPPRHPSVVRDLSILVADTLPAAAVRGTIRASAPPSLVRVREFDRYQGKGVPEGRVSLSYRLTFQAPDRTLTDAEVQRAMETIVQALTREHDAVQR
jgi:phenylalanyl-tRNA synthetase beta chain